MKTPASCIVFDLDGTLLNTIGDITRSLNAALKHHSFPVHDPDVVRGFIGHGIRHLVRSALPEENRDESAESLVSETMRREYLADPAGKAVIYPGVRESLLELRKTNIPLAVLSNKPHDLTAIICEKIFPGQFEPVIGESDRFPMKPDPESLLHIFRLLKADPASSWYVGDSPSDMETARRAGCRPVGVSWGFRPAQSLQAAGAEKILRHGEEIALLAAE